MCIYIAAEVNLVKTRNWDRSAQFLATPGVLDNFICIEVSVFCASFIYRTHLSNNLFTVVSRLVFDSNTNKFPSELDGNNWAHNRAYTKHRYQKIVAAERVYYNCNIISPNQKYFLADHCDLKELRVVTRSLQSATKLRTFFSSYNIICVSVVYTIVFQYLGKFA